VQGTAMEEKFKEHLSDKSTISFDEFVAQNMPY
jgi:hypothetical protein